MDRRVVKRVTSAGAAYNLDLGFKPNFVRVTNESTFATVSKPVWAMWTEGQGDGYYNLVSNQSNLTDGLISSTGTSNGFTPYDAEAFADLQKVIDTGASKVTKAANAVVTSTAHGLSTGDKVSFSGITSGMLQLNNLRSAVTVLTANTFSCDDIDSSNFSAWNSSEANGLFVVVSDTMVNAGFAGVTLGTAVVGDSTDVLIVEAAWFDNYGSVSA
jgi:hypothetical protein